MGYRAKPKFGGRIPASWNTDDGEEGLLGLSIFTNLITRLLQCLRRSDRQKLQGMKPDRPPRDSYTVDTG
jgi:uncharacterized protein with NAD-binding domain and iron-sulfur cluster